MRTQGRVLRTSEATRGEAGLAHVQRFVGERGKLGMAHLVFAPVAPRPLFLSLVRLANASSEAILLDYTELWRVAGLDFEREEGAAVCRTALGERALADVASGVRARAPEPLPGDALALDLRLWLPPISRRELCFAYAMPDPGESPAALVRAWRGEVRAELERTIAAWRRRHAEATDLLLAYRRG